MILRNQLYIFNTFYALTQIMARANLFLTIALGELNMPLSDMLFSNTHNVEQIVDIKHKKSVDKVLLKVVKTIRERGSITGWIKPSSDLRQEFQVTDRQMKSICSTLSEYYNVEIDPTQMHTTGDIVGLIKTNKARATDSLYLIDGGTIDRDENDDLEPKENLEVNPEIIKKSEPSVPSDIPIPEKSEPSIEGGEEEDDKAVPIDAVGKENILLAAIGAYSAVELASEIMSLYKDHDWDKLVERMGKSYEKIVSDIRKNHKDDPAFTKNRAILYNAKILKSAFSARIAQLRKLVNMPLPVIGEDVSLTENKLRAYFSPKMDPRVKPGEPSYLTLEEAGYLNPYVTKDLIRKIKECFDLQDVLDKKLFTYMTHADGAKYKQALEDAGVADHYHALYKEDWTEHFSTHVMRAVVNGLKGKSNQDIGSEQLESEPKKIEVSMEVMSSEQTNVPEDWGSMMDSL